MDDDARPERRYDHETELHVFAGISLAYIVGMKAAKEHMINSGVPPDVIARALHEKGLQRRRKQNHPWPFAERRATKSTLKQCECRRLHEMND
jgi:hypothetical protein